MYEVQAFQREAGKRVTCVEIYSASPYRYSRFCQLSSPLHHVLPEGQLLVHGVTLLPPGFFVSLF